MNIRFLVLLPSLSKKSRPYYYEAPKPIYSSQLQLLHILKLLSLAIFYLAKKILVLYIYIIFIHTSAFMKRTTPPTISKKTLPKTIIRRQSRTTESKKQVIASLQAFVQRLEENENSISNVEPLPSPPDSQDDVDMEEEGISDSDCNEVNDETAEDLLDTSDIEIDFLEQFFFCHTEVEPLTPPSGSQQGQEESYITRDFWLPENMFNEIETYSIRLLKLCESSGISSNSHRLLVDFINEVLFSRFRYQTPSSSSDRQATASNNPFENVSRV